MDGRGFTGGVEPDSSATLERAPPLGENRSTKIHRRAALRAYRRADKRRNSRFPFTIQRLRQTPLSSASLHPMRPCAQDKLPLHRSVGEKPLVGPARSRRPFHARTAPLYDARMGKEAPT